MKATDFRDATWEQIEGRLTRLRRLVWEGLINHGPCTTLALADATGIELLTVRPRVTELCQMGFARLADEQPDATEGRYEAVGIRDAEAAFRAAQAAARGEARQMDLRLTA